MFCFFCFLVWWGLLWVFSFSKFGLGNVYCGFFMCLFGCFICMFGVIICSASIEVLSWSSICLIYKLFGWVFC